MRNYARAASAFLIAALLTACSGGGGANGTPGTGSIPQSALTTSESGSSGTSTSVLASTTAGATSASSSHSPPPTAAQSATRTLASNQYGPAHAPIFEQMSGLYQTTQAGWNNVGKYVTYLMTDKRAANYAAAAGMKVGFYTDPIKVHGSDLSVYPAGAYAQACNGERIWTASSGTAANLGYPGNWPLASTFYGIINGMKQDQYGSYKYSWALADDSDDPGLIWNPAVFRIGSPTGAVPTPVYCKYSESDWTWTIGNMYNAAGVPVIFNGDTDPHYIEYMQGHNNIIGGECEGCISSPYLANNVTKVTGSVWQEQMNAGLIDIVNKKIFFLSADGGVPQDTVGYTYASYMLMYDQNYTLFRQDGATISGFGAPPTALIVPTEPLVATPTAIAALQWPTGAYAREYAACYIGGTYAGPCAAVVNPDPVKSVAWPYLSREYHHLLQFGGNGIATAFGDTGWANANGPHQSGSIPPAGWVITFN